jgi:hypothetical protein
VRTVSVTVNTTYTCDNCGNAWLGQRDIDLYDATSEGILPLPSGWVIPTAASWDKNQYACSQPCAEALALREIAGMYERMKVPA